MIWLPYAPTSPIPRSSARMNTMFGLRDEAESLAFCCAHNGATASAQNAEQTMPHRFIALTHYDVEERNECAGPAIALDVT